MFGIDDAVAAVAGIGGKLIDRLIPDPTAAADAKLKFAQMVQDGELARLTADNDIIKGQLEVNKTEAANTSVFVSGWRPAVGWVCATGLLSQFIFRPFALFTANLAHHPVDFPSLDMGTLLTLLAGMLGFGAMRSVEKINGVAAK
jgi:hypothetical protein